VRFFLSFIFICSMLATNAVAQPYVKMFGGVNYSKLRSESIYFSADYDAGAIVGGALGYRLKAPVPGEVSLELEGSHVKANFGSPGTPPPSCVDGVEPSATCLYSADDSFVDDFAHGNLRSVAGFSNIIYSPPKFHDRFSFYVGAGAGVMRAKFNYQEFVGVEVIDAIYIGSYVNAEMRQTSFSWQAIGGVAAQLGPHVELFAEGRYRRAVVKSEVLDSDVFAALENKTSMVNALAGVRFSFH